MINFLIGADPEVFVGDNLQARSIIDKIGGTKDHPLPMPIGEGFFVQEDNVALEFNIPVSASKQEFISNINAATKFLEQTMADRYGFHFLKESAISFPKEEMYDPRAHMFGCEPDFDAWTGRTNHKPKAEDPLLRSCGGHVHIGFKDLDKRRVIKGCDLILGVGSVMLDDGIKRKELYGKRGAYRPKAYGAEYRTLSNFWIFDERLTGWVYDGVGRALELAASDFDFDSEHDSITEAINNNNKEVAQNLIDKYQIALV